MNQKHMAAGFVTLAVALMVGFGSSVGAQMETSDFSGTVGFAGKALRIHMVDHSPKFILAEITGNTLNDRGDGLFHKMSLDCTFSIEVVDMPSTEDMGYCTFLDSDGDEFVVRAKSKGTLGVGAIGSFVAVSGTGKYKGITLTGTYRTTNVPDTTPNPRLRARDKFQGLITFSGNYHLP